MQSLTLAIEEDVLLAARKLAVDRNTTVNQLVRDYLAEVVATGDRRRIAREWIKQSMREKTVRVEARTWTRNELYER